MKRRRPWMDTLDDAMAARENRAPRRSIAVNYPLELYPLVQEAARTRGMSMTAYQRRAALAFAQWDLGFDWIEAMDHEPPVAAFESTGRGKPARGLGYGAWSIAALAAWEDDDGGD